MTSVEARQATKLIIPDLAAAPLGTDDEAAVMPPLEERRAAAATAPSNPREVRAFGPGSIYVAIIIATIAFVVAAALTLRRALGSSTCAAGPPFAGISK